MNKIEITVLSARVLDALSVRGLKAKTVREFERYGTRRIVQHCLDNGQTIYFKETVQDFVWQERARMESGALPHYQWVLTRRAAVYLDQMAKHGKIQGEPLRSWEAEHNPLFQNAPHSPSNSMKVIDIICRTRDAVIQLELSDKTKTNYIYCGFGPILNFFASRGEEFYSPETLALFVNKAKENYANGTIPKASFQTMRKAARWIEECLSTGRVSQRKLRKYNFACAPPEFENLLSQYQLYMQKQPLRVWLYARTADARPGVLEEQLNSLYREAERRGYTVVNGGAEHRCAGDLDRPALFAMLAAVRGGRVDAVMLTRLSRFSYHRLALYLILCFLQDHGVGLITTEYELRYILYLRGFERTLLDRAQENGCNALWAEGE